MKLLVLNGPNMNMLGKREPNIYGQLTLDELNQQLVLYIQELNEQIEDAETKIELYFYQSNYEGVLIDVIQRAQEKFDGIVYNPAAHTHYSIAIRDAIASVPTPVVEVHLSNINARESFRKNSVISIVCVGQHMGRGIESYKDGIVTLAKYVKAKRIAEEKREQERMEAEQLEALEQERASAEAAAEAEAAELEAAAEIAEAEAAELEVAAEAEDDAGPEDVEGALGAEGSRTEQLKLDELEAVVEQVESAAKRSGRRSDNKADA